MSIRIDFVRPREWIIVWTVAAMVTCAAVAAAIVMVLDKNRQARLALSMTSAATLQVQALRGRTQAAAEAARTDPTVAGIKAVSVLLQLDLNPFFAVIENVAEPGTRLVSAQFDAGSQDIRLEYDVETLAHAATLTSALNAGYDTPPWRLEAVTSISLASNSGTGSRGMRASWTSKLALLR